MNDDILELARGLAELWKEQETRLELIINDIINSNNTDIKYIEKTLDLCLDLPTDKGEELFFKLCNYFSNVHEEDALEYMEIYKELNEEDDFQKSLKI